MAVAGTKSWFQSPLCPLVANQPFLWASVTAQWPHFGYEDSVTSAGTTLGAAGTREPEGRRKPGGQEQAPAPPPPAPGSGTWDLQEDLPGGWWNNIKASRIAASGLQSQLKGNGPLQWESASRPCPNWTLPAPGQPPLPPSAVGPSGPGVPCPLCIKNE